MTVIIYQPAKTAMQSGTANTRDWVLEFPKVETQTPDPLKGWTTQADTLQELNLTFPTVEAAIAYAEKHGLKYTVVKPKSRKVKPKAYADNFKFDKVS